MRVARKAAWGSLLGLLAGAACGGGESSRPPVGTAAFSETAAPSPAWGEIAPAAATELFRHDFEQVHFGNVPVQLSIYATDGEQAREAAGAAFARVAELGAMMSDYAFDPPSPLNRIAADAPAPVAVPAELLEVLRLGVEAHRRTGGAFDITAKPFVQLWRVSRRLGELPPPERLQRAATFVDIDALELDPEAGTARLGRQGMWLDVGGVAKGWIGDRVVELLRARGLRRCRYHAGGDMVFGDPPPGEPGWLVEVPDLLVADGSGAAAALRFRIANGAASVSGDLHRYVEIDGLRYAHVIDPRTGLGVTERRVACVRGTLGADTDPLATAGLVMGRSEWRDALVRGRCQGDLAVVGG